MAGAQWVSETAVNLKNSLTQSSSLLNDLRNEFAKSKVLFVVGAGVSIMASGNAPAASWKGLLRHGAQRVKDLGRCSADTAKRIQDQIESDDLDEMLGAATFIAKKLGGHGDGEFRKWLKETVGDIAPKEPAVIEAIAQVDCAILTTNYDSLIEMISSRSPITWRNMDRCEQFLHDSKHAIIHIHGHWESPDSVILGQDSYALITSNERVQTFIRAAHLAKTFVYVGCGEGLSDPNFSQFLDWCERLFADSQTRRYRLARENEIAALQAKHPPGQRVQVIPYGIDYSDLVPFLKSLRPPSALIVHSNPHASTARKLLPNKAPNPRFELRGIDWYEESDAAYLHGRTTDIERVKQLLVAHPVVRLAAPSGTGKSSLLRAGIVPALRKLGWRAVVIRPYDDPGSIFPGELTRTVLDTRSKPFLAPLDHYTLRQQLSPLLEHEACPCLALLIDQVEDILSPTAAVGAKAWLRDLLREIHRWSDSTPMLRVVISYRTDAEAQFGRLWQEASGNSAGFPYHSLLGITPEDAQTVISEVAERMGWILEITPKELASQLAAESRGVVNDTSIFPPYLQILLSTVASIPDKRVTAAIVLQLGGVRGILATYLRRLVDELINRGGDFQHIPSVLQAVCRSSGEKLRLSKAEIAEHARLPEATTLLLLNELVRQRLVRPLGGDSFEIQHDRLAEVIIAELDPLERESKEANELLRSKAASFKSTKALLTDGEIELLFRHRKKLALREDSDRLLTASVLSLYQSESVPPVGWSWVRTKSLGEIIELLGKSASPLRYSVRKAVRQALSKTNQDLDLLINVLTRNPCKLRDSALKAIEVWNNAGDAEKLRQLLRHKEAKIRRASSLALRRGNDEKSRRILRRLAEDDLDHGVRRAAMEGLAELHAGDITALRKIAITAGGNQPKRAVELLAAKVDEATTGALRLVLQKAQVGVVRACAARILLGQPSEAAETAKLIQNSPDWRLRCVLAEKAASLEVLQPLTDDRTESVRNAALLSIGQLQTDAGYEWLAAAYNLGPHKSRPGILQAIALSAHPKSFGFLRAVAESSSTWEHSALRAITMLGTAEGVTFLIEQSALWKPANDKEETETEPLYDLTTEPTKKTPANPFHTYISQAIAAIRDPAFLPKLRAWSQSPIHPISAAAIRTYGQLTDPSQRIWMLELVGKADHSTLGVIFEALKGLVLEDPKPLFARFSEESDRKYYNEAPLGRFIEGQTDRRSLPALREIITKATHDLRRPAILALGRFSDDSDLPLLTSVARDTRDSDRVFAIYALSHYKHADAIGTLREIALADSHQRHAAALVFSLSASPTERAQLLEECVRVRKFDIGGILDFQLNAPAWWPRTEAWRP